MSSPERQFRDHQGQVWGVRIEVLVPKIVTTVGRWRQVDGDSLYQSSVSQSMVPD